MDEINKSEAISKNKIERKKEDGVCVCVSNHRICMASKLPFNKIFKKRKMDFEKQNNQRKANCSTIDVYNKLFVRGDG